MIGIETIIIILMIIWIFEYEDISSVIEAQEILVSQLDQIRHLLVEIDEEGNVTEPASGTLIHREPASGWCLIAVCGFISWLAESTSA